MGYGPLGYSNLGDQSLVVGDDLTVADDLTVTDGPLVVGNAAGSPIVRLSKADAGTGTFELYNNQAGTPRLRADMCLTATEDLAFRVYNSSAALVATWTFFSDGDSQVPAGLIFSAGTLRIAGAASTTPIGGQSAQPTSVYLQRDSGRRWFKKSATNNTGWHPEYQCPPQTQTTDATVTTVATFPMQDNSAVFVTADVTAKTNATAGCKAFKVVALARRHATGGATIVGTPTDLTGGALADAALATAAVTVDGSTNDIRVRVTGVAATTINWNVVVTFSESRDTV